MQNKITKPEKTISPSNLPSIITAVVLIVGIGAVYGLVGYLFYGIKENITPVIQVSENGSDLDKVEESVVFEGEEDIFSDWKVYRNEEFGVEFQYPKDFSFFMAPKLIVTKIDSDDLSAKKCIEEKSNYRTVKEISIGENTFCSYEMWHDPNPAIKENIDYKYSIIKEDKRYTIHLVIKNIQCGVINETEEAHQAYTDCKIKKLNSSGMGEAILSTFKFIEKDETVDWEVYRNEEFGFEFKYPEDYSLKEPSNSYIYLKSKDNETIFGRIVNIEIEEKTLINDKFSLSDASKISFEEFISKNIKVGCAASRSGLDGSLERYCTNEIEIKPFLNTKGITGYEIYITEITETKIAGKTTTEKRKKGPIFAFNISEYNLNRGLLFQLSGEVEESLEKEMYSKILNQILSTFKFIEKDETADWKVYRNEEFGFEFQYPEEWGSYDKLEKLAEFQKDRGKTYNLNNIPDFILSFEKKGFEIENQYRAFTLDGLPAHFGEIVDINNYCSIIERKNNFMGLNLSCKVIELNNRKGVLRDDIICVGSPSGADVACSFRRILLVENKDSEYPLFIINAFLEYYDYYESCDHFFSKENNCFDGAEEKYKEALEKRKNKLYTFDQIISCFKFIEK